MNIPLKYNVRNLFVRRGTTAMTILSIAFVVLVYVGVLSLAAGLRVAFGRAGDARNVIVLREGANSETESFFALERFRELTTVSGIATAPDGSPLVSGELLLLQVLEREDGTESNVALRGVQPVAFTIRPQIQIVEGRPFQPGTAEVIVGERIASRFPELSLGRTIEFGRQDFRVVGVFSDGGGAFASEVWAAFEDLGNAFDRVGFVSSALLQAPSAEHTEGLIARIQADQRLTLGASSETQYYRQQAQATGTQFIVLGNALAVMMAFGACFAAANTMYASVSARASEIGTLRALGFKRRSILGAFLFESALVGLLAGCVGALLALPLNSIQTGTTNFVTFSEVSFRLRTTPDVLAGGIALAVLTSLIGGFAPAWSASRRQIALLLRDR